MIREILYRDIRTIFKQSYLPNKYGSEKIKKVSVPKFEFKLSYLFFPISKILSHLFLTIQTRFTEEIANILSKLQIYE